MDATIRQDAQSEIMKNIKNLMIYNDIDTEAELSRRSGLTAQTISRILKGGTNNPGVETLMPLAKVLGVTISQLIGELPIQSHQANETQDHKPKSVPLLYWEQANQWEKLVPEKGFQNWPDWTITTMPTSRFTYALKITSHTFEKFPFNTILIIDPEVELADGDFIIVYHTEEKRTFLKRYVHDGGEWLHSLILNHPPEKMTKSHVACGVVMQSTTAYRAE